MNIDYVDGNKSGYHYKNAKEREKHIEKLCKRGYICTHFSGTGSNLAATFVKEK